MTDTISFVDEVFRAIHSKVYVPGYVPPPTAPTAPSQTFPSLNVPQPVRANVPIGPTRGFHRENDSRKRSYNDRKEIGNGLDPHYAQGGRQIKQMRNGGRGGRGNAMSPRGGRGGAFNEPAYSHVAPPMPLDFSNMPLPQGMPFDPNDPLGAMLAMQSLGLPPLPGLPPFPQAGSPNGRVQTGSPRFLPPNARAGGSARGRCRDYNNKGYCTRGDACPYQHNSDRIVMPGQDGKLIMAQLAPC